MWDISRPPDVRSGGGAYLSFAKKETDLAVEDVGQLIFQGVLVRPDKGARGKAVLNDGEGTACVFRAHHRVISAPLAMRITSPSEFLIASLGLTSRSIRPP